MPEIDLSKKTELETALSDVRENLAADGYGLVLTEPAPGVLSVAVTATPEACKECLVSKNIFIEVIKMSLPESMSFDTITVDYPGESGAHHG